MKDRNATTFAGRWRVFVFGLLAAAAAAPAVADVAISQVPLFVSTSVRPNVMLQFDNSGSMNSIIWHEDYVPTEEYSGPFSGSGYETLGRDGRIGWSENCRWEQVRGEWRYVCDEYHLTLPGPSTARYHANYLNWLVDQHGAGADLTGGQIPEQTRLEVAKQVARQLVDDNGEVVRLGLAAFNYDEGGYIAAACASDNQATLQSSIDALGADTWTPLAETYYEVTRYFRGLGRHWGSGDGDYASPAEYPCQKNFVIVITDGLPTYDHPNIDSADDPDLPGPDGQGLPDWDEQHEETDGPPYPQYSDGTDPGTESATEGATLYLDDLAKFGYDLDLSDGDADEPQRLETYTVGFTVDNQMLEDAADYGNGEYFTANNLEELTTALQGALSSIADKTSTAASLAASSTEAAGETSVFQATFSSGNWSGELASYPYESVGVDAAAHWRASERIPAHDTRNVLTYEHGEGGIAFQWDELDASAQAALDDDASILSYIRGFQGDEGTEDGAFRRRSDGVLGDIVHSTPAFVGDQSFGYSLLPGAAGSSYRSYALGKGDVTDIVLVGANDGMLHAFVADGDQGGNELFAYVPRSLFPALPRLADQDYDHRYYVDGSPAVADVYLDDAWRTVAVTTLGAGGPGAFALDVSAPDSFGTDDVLWEVDPDNLAMKTGSGTPGDHMGTAMGTPAVVRTESGDWVAIFGNGYNSAAGTAALVVVELASGKVLRVLDTGAGGDNGLATPAAVDRDRNGSVDTVYAGDLQGNLWKFDLSHDRSRDWAIPYSDGNGDPLPLFTARDSGGSRQPITARPDAMVSPHGGLMVVFGTGKYLGLGDPVSTATQSVYGIWDIEGVTNDAGNPVTDTRVSGLDELQRQYVTRQTSVGDVAVRVLSRESVDYEGEDAQRGWVFDLSYARERINRDATIFDGKAILVSTIPNTDPCTFGGRSALIEINPLTGSQFDEPILDLNDDEEFDEDDGVTDGDGGDVTYPGMVDLDVGLATNPNILIRPDDDHEKQISGSNLNTQTVGEKGFFRPGRASWQQIR